MHPILAEPRRSGLYLLCWTPLATLAVVLLVVQAGASWREALLLGLPLVGIYAYLCLAAWYVCRAVPLKNAQPLRLAMSHLGAALLSSALWWVLGWAWIWLLGMSASQPGVEVFAIGVPLYLVTAAVHYLLEALESSRDAEREALQSRLQVRESELKALKSQLDPHFLFNSLNAISSLTGTDPAAARKMAILLADFLRRSLRLGNLETVPLHEELALAAGYLAVERVRFGERLEVVEEIDAASRECRVPPLLLQPLVENAVRHGIAQLLEGGTLRIEGRREGDRLSLAVENPCDPDHPVQESGEGVGIANVAARLELRYHRAARLEVKTPHSRFRVEITLPAETV
jgi:two-component system, LytTR family, sensor histidine kinase AlgZ